MYAAKMYIGTDFTPGEILPEDLPKGYLERLIKAGAVKEVGGEPAGTRKPEAPAIPETPEPEAPEEAKPEAAEEPAEAEEAEPDAPEIDVTAAIAEKAAPKKTTRKGAKAK